MGSRRTLTPSAITIAQGKVQGLVRDGVDVFLGIPFGGTTGGAGRFKAPQPAAGWSGVRICDEFGPKALQMRNPTGGGLFHPMSEDCLTLNVFAPRHPGPHPVLVWVHGGGALVGGPANRMLDATKLAAGGLVVVTVSYRLGPLGYLRLGHLLGDDYAGSENNALRDLALALKWVHDNIAPFGGDGANITIGGESAGAKNSLNLLAMPATRALLRGVISESGSAISFLSAQGAEDVTSALLEKLSIPARDAERILTTDGAALIAAAGGVRGLGINQPWRPVVDGVVLPTDTLTAAHRGDTRDVAVLIGSTDNEYDTFAVGRVLDRADPTTAYTTHLSDPDVVAQVLTAYRELDADGALTPRHRRLQMMTAEEYWMPSVRFAEAHSQAGGQAWMYRFDWAPRHHPLRLRAAHMMELPFVFDTFSSAWGRALTLRTGAAERALSARIRTAWTAFVREQRPSSEPDWIPYGDRRNVMTINHAWNCVTDPKGAERRLWDGVL